MKKQTQFLEMKNKFKTVEELNRHLKGDEDTEVRRGDRKMETVRGVKKHKRWTFSHGEVLGYEPAPTINN